MNKTVVFIIGLFVGVLVIGGLLVGGYFIFKDKFDFVTTEVPEDTAEPTPSASPSNTYDFSGTYVDATLPIDWSIIEYENGNGTTMLVTGPVYTGLTALEVVNPATEVVFKLSAVFGIGGVDFCKTYAKFDDFNQSDFDTLNAKNIADYAEEIELVDVSAQPYTSFNFLGLSVRRIETTLYWDKVNGNSYFEPASCGLEPNYPIIDALYFNADGVGENGYQWKIVGTPSNADLINLDGILNTLVSK